MTTTQAVPQRTARQEQERATRRRREDLGVGRMRTLAINGRIDPDYEYRWVNDKPGRVQMLTTDDDWDVVTTDMVGQRDAKDKGVGSIVERVVDKTNGARAVLLRKRKDYYTADKAKEQAAVAENEAALARGQSNAPGSLQASDPDKAYVPRGGIVIDPNRG